MALFRLKNKDGSLLIASILVMLIVFAAIVQFVSWARQFGKANVHRIATQKALMNADSGIQMALTFLRTPQATLVKAPPNAPYPLYPVINGTTSYVLMARHSTDPTLVDVNSNGYYEVPDGSAIDPNGLPSQRATVAATVQLHDVGDYILASQGGITISYGSNMSSGVIYGQSLTFGQGASNPKTIVKSAQYTLSISPANYSNYVTFLDPNSPYQLSTPPSLPTLDASMANVYLNMASAPGSQLAPGTVLSGNLAPPAVSTYPVYFCTGDVTLGSPGINTTVTKSVLIYSQGDIHIANNLLTAMGTTAWPALMAQGNIYIDAAAPPNLTVNGTMVTNGVIQALGSSRPLGNTLTINGGMVVGSNGDLSTAYWGTRTYTYHAPDPTLPLPFITTISNYNVVSGKFNQ